MSYRFRPEKHQSSFKRFVTIVVTVFVLAIIGAVIFGGYLLNGFFTRQTLEENDISFVIAEGEGVNEISQHLKDKELIGSMFTFETYVWLRDLQSSFRAGTHTLQTNMTPIEITKALTAATAVADEHKITIIEGWSNNEIGEYLEQERVVSQDEFLAAVTRYNKSHDFLEGKPADVDVEGFLFPDTYRIFADATADDIVAKMVNNFDRRLTDDLRHEIEKSGRTIFEVITLASIVEKEVIPFEDRRMVADLFYRRIEIGMPLQADSTVNYVTGKSDPSALLVDAKTNSPYNTYKNRGLPPGPISNPGLDSIKAVVNPKANNNVYFLTTSEGKTIFSKTFDEHVENKFKYLK